jgi:hypothetical protein
MRPPLSSECPGVGHEVESLPDVRRADARSAGIRRPDGVTRSLQVSRNKVEPREARAARNLFAKHDVRAALADEPEPVGPEVPGVGKASGFARCAERLARAGAGPDGPVVRPAGAAQRVAPHPDSGKEVALPEPPQILSPHVTHISLIDLSRRNVSTRDQRPQPRRGKRIAFVVVGAVWRHRGTHGSPNRRRLSRRARQRAARLSACPSATTPAHTTTAMPSHISHNTTTFASALMSASLRSRAARAALGTPSARPPPAPTV